MCAKFVKLTGILLTSPASLPLKQQLCHQLSLSICNCTMLLLRQRAARQAAAAAGIHAVGLEPDWSCSCAAAPSSFFAELDSPAAAAAAYAAAALLVILRRRTWKHTFCNLGWWQIVQGCSRFISFSENLDISNNPKCKTAGKKSNL